MAVTYYTLEYDGTEQTFQDWGFAAPMQHRRDQAPGGFTVRVPGIANLVADPPVPFKGQVIIRKGRTAGLTGGTVVFQGRQTTDRITANRSPANTLTFSDALWDLANTPYQQSWLFKASGVAAATKPFSRLVLMHNYADRTVHGVHYAAGALIPNGVQIEDIVNFAATSCGVALQVGTVDPVMPLTYYPVRGCSCLSAIQICLKPQPDATIWIDHSTTPPTFNCFGAASRTRVTIHYAASPFGDVDFSPRPDLQVPQVVLQYQKVNQEGDTSWSTQADDSYPADGFGGGPTGGLAVGALVVPIDLRGARVTDVRVTAAAMPSASDLTSFAASGTWWTKKYPRFADTHRIKNVTIVTTPTTLSIKDDAGADVDLADWPNELIEGPVNPLWMRNDSSDTIDTKWVTVKAGFTYDEFDVYSGVDRLHSKAGVAGSSGAVALHPHEIAVRVRLTNSATGTIVYSFINDAGETAPTGLAQAIYTALHPLQYEGSVTINENNTQGMPSAQTDVDTKHKLCISGGKAEWATMDATVRGVDIDLTTGATTITVGPARHLSASDYEELLQFWRFRSVVETPQVRIDANFSAGSMQGGGAGQAENTATAAQMNSLHTVAGNQTDTTPGIGTVTNSAGTTYIQHDGQNEAIVLMRVGQHLAGDGVTPLALDHTHTSPAESDWPIISISLRDMAVLLGAGALNRTMQLRWFYFKDANDSCSSKKMIILSTAPEAA